MHTLVWKQDKKQTSDINGKEMFYIQNGSGHIVLFEELNDNNFLRFTYYSDSVIEINNNKFKELKKKEDLLKQYRDKEYIIDIIKMMGEDKENLTNIYDFSLKKPRYVNYVDISDEISFLNNNKTKEDLLVFQTRDYNKFSMLVKYIKKRKFLNNYNINVILFVP